jgi:ABC-2 type transport system permease protein
MGEWFAIYRRLVVSSVKSRLVYRWNFGVSLILQTLAGFGELAALLLIVRRVHGVAGWSADELIFLFGLLTTSRAFYKLFASELSNFDKYLVNGEFDAVLTRPVPSLLAIAARSIDIEQLALFIQGIIVLIWGYVRLSPKLHFTGWTVCETVIGVLCGTMIWFAVVTAIASIGFWTTRVDELQPVLLYGPQTAMNYPLDIYPKFIQAIFLSILPVAFGTYIPASVILNKGLPPIWLCYSLVVSILSISAALVLWNLGVRRYTSTGT